MSVRPSLPHGREEEEEEEAAGIAADLPAASLRSSGRPGKPRPRRALTAPPPAGPASPGSLSQAHGPMRRQKAAGQQRRRRG